jgi:hypothetical protein
MPAEHATTCEDIQPWLAAHALGEADADAEQQAHLAACPRCRSDLREYRLIAGLLPYDAPDAAPAPDLRDRLVAAVAREAGTATPEAATRPPKPASARAAPRRRSIFSPAGWAAAGFAALAVALLAWNLSLRARIDEQAALIAFHRQTWQVMTPLLNDPSLRWYALAGDRASGRLWSTPQGETACLVAQGLPQLAEGQVLQVWLMRGGERTSGGTFQSRDGNGWVLVSGGAPLASYDSVAVTIEPSGGSAAPSGPPVIGGSLAVAGAPGSADRQELLRLLVEDPQRDV